MNKKTSFLSLAEMKQPVNQWLCIAFIGVFCFWTMLYYFVQKADAVGKNFAITDMDSYIID